MLLISTRITPVHTYNRGVAYAEKSCFDSAIKDYNIAIELKPDGFAEGYNNRGVTYSDKGEY